MMKTEWSIQTFSRGSQQGGWLTGLKRNLCCLGGLKVFRAFGSGVAIFFLSREGRIP